MDGRAGVLLFTARGEPIPARPDAGASTDAGDPDDPKELLALGEARA